MNDPIETMVNLILEGKTPGPEDFPELGESFWEELSAALKEARLAVRRSFSDEGDQS